MKGKLKSYEFWVSIVSAVMVVLQSLSIKFQLPYIQEAVMGFLGILAVAGIVKKNEPPTSEGIVKDDDIPTQSTPQEDTKENE